MSDGIKELVDLIRNSCVDGELNHEGCEHITEYVFQQDSYSHDYKFADFVQIMSNHLMSIPEEFRDNADIEIRSEHIGYGGYEVGITISYERPETDQEFAERTAQEKDLEAQRKKEHQTKELEALAYLKAKYSQ